MAQATDRLFVALDLPASARAALAEFRDAEADPELWRPVPDEALHVTLVFLGHRPPGESDAVAAVLRECAGAAPDLALGAALLLPPRRAAGALRGGRGPFGHPRGAAGPRLGRSGGGRAARAGAAAVPPARHRGAAASRRSRAAAGTARRPAPVSFAGEAVTLYRSRLSRAGAAYEPLERIAVA